MRPPHHRSRHGLTCNLKVIAGEIKDQPVVSVQVWHNLWGVAMNSQA